MSKHAPGPWTASPRQDGLYNIYAGPHDVALCVAPDNAALIAAAPSMLAALQAVEFMLSIPLEHEQDLVESRARALSMARAAIAKATGTD